MPRSRNEIPDYMIRTGRTDQFKGTEFKCGRCGARRWTAWANAHRHGEHCPGEEAEA